MSGQDGEGVVGALLQLGGGRHQHRAVPCHRHAAPHRALPCLVLIKEGQENQWSYGVPHLAECDVVCVHTGQVLQGRPGDRHTRLVNLLSSYYRQYLDSHDNTDLDDI